MTTPTRPNPSLTSDDTMDSLKWLAERTVEEQKSLREMDDKLFSWSATLFVSAFGALAGLSGLATKQWGPLWRTLLVIGLITLIGSLLLLASQIRANLLRKQADLNQIVAQMAQARGHSMPMTPLDLDGGLFFFVRWGIITILGTITLVLTWLTFS
ncbi:MAG: hypothetical protein KF716_02505 [Anaerolineae bacterium]|nr:hypothetical protein [Anaerolineae bacterium]